MDLKINGKHALITGGSKGIGFATARRLADEGCRVTLASRSDSNLAEAVRLIPNAHAISLDMSEEKSIRSACALLVAEAPVDILIINSGGPPPGFLKELTLEQWDLGYRVLIRSTILLTEICTPHMRSQRWGRILNITSTSAVQVISNLPISGTFRSGLTAWTKHAAKEFGKDGILINSILPGPTRTDRLKELRARSPETVAAMESGSALGRIAEADEIAAVAAFLVSGANTYLTGTDVLVDGGFTAAL